MNFAKDDYAMGHILTFARETGKDTLVIDFLSGEGRPPELLRDPIEQLPQRYTKMFWHIVESSGSDRAMVQFATLTLKYELGRLQSAPIIGKPECPYTCEILILDTRNKSYSAHFSGWWYAEKVSLSPNLRFSWNPLNWFRKT